jgi:thiosulfate dehydrogenase
VEEEMRFLILSMVLMSSLIFTFGIGQNSFAENSSYQQADIRNGGLLYDNWPKMKKADIKDTHPIYPADSKKSGKSTWRCKECHGWDYIGKDGRYSKGSHYTGIEGVYGERSEEPKDIFDDLTDKEDKHDFSAYLADTEIWDLVKFLREGQVDIKTALDDQGNAKGDAAKGKVLYNANCTSCHGADGNEMDFKGKKDGIQGVGWLANDNPQESLHKIRWGHPGSDMPSMVIDAKLSDQDAVDILKYSQSMGK